MIGGYLYCTGKYDAISAWAIIVTGAVVIWYTWETMQLRREAFSQREMQLRPFITFYKGDSGYVIENIGHGVALDVYIDTVKLDDTEIRFPQRIPILKQNIVLPFQTEIYINGKRIDEIFTAILDHRYTVSDINLNIQFSNIEGKRYSLVEIISPKMLSLRGFKP